MTWSGFNNEEKSLQCLIQLRLHAIVLGKKQKKKKQDSYAKKTDKWKPMQILCLARSNTISIYFSGVVVQWATEVGRREAISYLVLEWDLR